MIQERRKRTRIPFHTEVKIIPVAGDAPTEKEYKTILRDIGMSGIFVDSDYPVPPGVKCDVQIIMKGKKSRLVMEVSGTVTRQDTNGYGLQFDDDLEWWTLFSIYKQFGQKQQP